MCAEGSVQIGTQMKEPTVSFARLPFYFSCQCVGYLHRGDLHCQSPTWDWVVGPGAAGSCPAGHSNICGVKSYPQFFYISSCN